MVATHPDIIMLGLTPGPDSITAIKAIRAQNPTIPISECSACNTPSFINAVGGPTAMKNVYLIGTISDLAGSPDKADVTDVNHYLAAMKAAGLGSANILQEGLEGWDTSEELAAAIKKAGSIDTEAVRKALQHQSLDTLGIHWKRTPSNYGAITHVDTAFDIITPAGTTKVIGYPTGGPGE